MASQNIYDNEEFYKGYITLPRQTHGLDGAPEWPTIKTMLPNLTGKRVVDLGCGFGWFSRWARENGAEAVLGLDVSKNMIAKAKEMTEDLAIEYRIADLSVLELPEASFDFAYSALAFHYIEDFSRLVRMVHNALTSGSIFVFEIEHPVFTAPSETRWIGDEAEKKSWALNSYSMEGERRRDWFTQGVLKYHRTVATTINALISAGFAIKRVEEYSPTSEAVESDPSLVSELERPMFLTISAER